MLTDFLCQDHQDQGVLAEGAREGDRDGLDRLEEKVTTPPARVHDRDGKPPPVAVSVPLSWVSATAEPDVPSELTVSLWQVSSAEHCRSWPTTSNGADGGPIPPPKSGIQLQSGCHCHCHCQGEGPSGSPVISATSSKPKPTVPNVSSGNLAVPW